MKLQRVLLVGKNQKSLLSLTPVAAYPLTFDSTVFFFLFITLQPYTVTLDSTTASLYFAVRYFSVLWDFAS